MGFLADIIFFFSRKNVVSLCSVYALALVDVWYWQWQIVTLCESSGVVDFCIDL